MRFRASAGLVCLVVLFVLQSSGAGAATLFVRTDGSDTLCNGSADADASATPNCALASIGAAIGAAIASDTVAIGPGTFVENVIVTKALTLDGAGSSGASLTTIVPALSGPTCTSGTGSICTGGSNVILVQADDVTIRDIVVDGDNPALTSGIVSDGADLDARNGIIEDYSLGAFHRLTVAGVVVRNIYLRGIYAASGGQGFALTGNTVTNVQADPTGNSLCIFAFGGGGTGVARGAITGNTVSHCTVGLASNWSQGVDYTANTVSGSQSGVQTSNTQGADVIEDNTITAGLEIPATGLDGGWGILVFATDAVAAQTVRGNTVSGVDTGILVSGQRSSTAPMVLNNSIDLADRAGSLGVGVTTRLFGWGSAATNAQLVGNTITRAETGIYVEAEAGFAATLLATRNTLIGNGAGIGTSADAAMTGTYVLEAHGNRIAGNTTGLRNATTATFDATNNWWGCNYGPAAAGDGCTTAPNGVAGAGTTTAAPWLVLGQSGPPAFPAPANDYPVETTLRLNSASSDVGAIGTVKDGTAVAFVASFGSIPSPVGTVAGIASTIYSAPASPGLGSLTATLDGQTLATSFLVAAPVSADVRTGLTGSTSVRVGETITATAVVSNHGPAVAAGTVLTFSVPSGVSLQSISGDCTELPCALGDLALAASRTATATFLVAATYSGPSPFVVTAEAHATNADPLPDNNSESVTVRFFPESSTTDYFTVTPCRVVDTRVPAMGGPALTTGVIRTFVVSGSCDVPTTARAVALNMTVTQTEGAGFVQLYPAGSPTPLVSAVNYAKNTTRANNAVIALGSLGDVTALAGPGTGTWTLHLILDVVGYFE